MADKKIPGMRVIKPSSKVRHLSPREIADRIEKMKAEGEIAGFVDSMAAHTPGHDLARCRKMTHVGK